MDSKEQIIIKREDRLLENENSWRRARIGAFFLSVVCIIAFLAITWDDLISKDERIKSLTALVIWCLFWLLIIDWLTLRIQHIDSINFYRKKYSTKENNDGSQG